jgi:hypothetical protein
MPDFSSFDNKTSPEQKKPELTGYNAGKWMSVSKEAATNPPHPEMDESLLAKCWWIQTRLSS